MRLLLFASESLPPACCATCLIYSCATFGATPCRPSARLGCALKREHELDEMAGTKGICAGMLCCCVRMCVCQASGDITRLVVAVIGLGGFAVSLREQGQVWRNRRQSTSPTAGAQCCRCPRCAVRSSPQAETSAWVTRGHFSVTGVNRLGKRTVYARNRAMPVPKPGKALDLLNFSSGWCLQAS